MPFPFPGEGNIPIRRQKPAEAFSLCAGSCRHNVAHSKETDDLSEPSSAKPSVKGLHIHQHKRLWAEGVATAKTTILGLCPQPPGGGESVSGLKGAGFRRILSSTLPSPYLKPVHLKPLNSQFEKEGNYCSILSQTSPSHHHPQPSF